MLLLALAPTTAQSAPRGEANQAFQPNPRKLNPPPGITVPSEVRAELTAGVEGLSREIDSLRLSLSAKPDLLALLPDVQIFHNAVQYALEDDIFYSTNQFKTARLLLKQGMERAQQLREGRTPWISSTGLVVRGYISRLDGSVQPYGLVVPPGLKPGNKPMRLDIWLHGRGDNLNEIAFIDGRQKSAGEFTPHDTFVLHPYGRFMNAFKFAGEVDVFEALQHAMKHYPIDENRLVMRGFSMGGAGAWHLGAHHASKWASVNPGAGFVDVKNYQHLEARLSSIPWYEQQLWNFYDPLACPINLINTSLIAYSGEIDEQKKAADLMEAALAGEGVKMTHIIGAKTGHKYEPEAKKVVAELVDAAANKNREVVPRKVTLVTYSLKWNEMHWLRIDALEKHWEMAEATAEIVPQGENSRIEVKTRNVGGVTLNIVPASILGKGATLVFDGQNLGFQPASSTGSDSRWSVSANRKATSGNAPAGSPKGWALGSAQSSGKQLSKRHNLQGPIDDAFMDSFLFVRPTGKPLNDAVGSWVEAELAEAKFQWRRQFRGQPRIKDDTAVTEEDIASANLVLWGDPSSNKLLGRIADKLPIRWTDKTIKAADNAYDAAKHVAVLIYPNPLNPARYLVLNSGFTFSQFASGSNAQQTPKLPDWAVLDLSVPVSQRIGGKGVIAADFFEEQWKLQEPPLR